MGRKIRNVKKTILIGAEGKNKTESTYFSNFNDRNSDYRIIMANGNSTDPVRMVDDIIKTMKQRDINTKYGDLIYCVLDVDDSKEKALQISKAIKLASKHNIEIITSNPCFEDWFLCHFTYTTKHFSNNEIIQEIKKYISKYSKGLNVYELIKDKTEIAIVNAKKQSDYHKNLEIDTSLANPSTMVFKIVEALQNK